MLIVTGFRKIEATYLQVHRLPGTVRARNGIVRIGERSQKPSSNFIVSIRSIIITFVTMKLSPSLMATWVVLSSSGVWVSVKNDDVEVTVVALSCTLLRLFSSGQKKPVVFHNLFIPAKATMKQQGRNKF